MPPLQDLVRELVSKGASVEEIYRLCLGKGYDGLETLNAVSAAGLNTSEFIGEMKGRGQVKDT